MGGVCLRSQVQVQQQVEAQPPGKASSATKSRWHPYVLPASLLLGQSSDSVTRVIKYPIIERVEGMTVGQCCQRACQRLVPRDHVAGPFVVSQSQPEPSSTEAFAASWQRIVPETPLTLVFVTAGSVRLQRPGHLPHWVRAREACLVPAPWVVVGQPSHGAYCVFFAEVWTQGDADRRDMGT